jgi:4-hydroxybenzoyl-CoA thioesterase
MIKNEFRRRVEWSECDPARIVFYPNYFAWFDEATWRLFAKVGFPPDELKTQLNFAGMPILEAKSKFLGPSRFFEEVVIESHVAEWRDKTFDVVHRISNNGALTVEGVETRAWCEPHPDDPSRLKARPVPKIIVERLSAAG